MKKDSEFFLNAALVSALGAGERILEVYEKPHIEKELKEDSTPVTEADRSAHATIMKHLQSTGIPVLSEEGRNISYEERRTWKVFWLVDPLDGTKEFLRKNGEFTINIALIEGQKPYLGVLYAPLLDLLYFSSPGEGAFRLEGFAKNWKDRVSCRDLRDSSQALPLVPTERKYRVVASRSHGNRHTSRYIRTLNKLHPGLETVSRGSALKFCLVAEGSADIYPRFGPTWEWDSGAGHAIAEAAGCRVRLHNREESLLYNKENLLNPWFIVERKT